MIALSILYCLSFSAIVVAIAALTWQLTLNRIVKTMLLREQLKAEMMAMALNEMNACFEFRASVTRETVMNTFIHIPSHIKLFHNMAVGHWCIEQLFNIFSQ
jgi:hypothetical protein